ncbi:DNA-binding response OmpR family regulator [Pedobacter sp. W3I1]|uniref:response regulator n=1 Tax=Pedobacter sp. W3I1 TaxID=3042291 RepID=UPI002786573A|nr:response regulator [Pedobacter sp. W3I1]MDQ0637831.1 DNA-binding response OmpR family regulator [Pedobacter sp. W3I1]
MYKILIQETEESILEVLTIALEAEGFMVKGMLGVNPGFLNIINDFRPHVVILDFRLRGDDAIEICSTIKKQYPFLPILALSCNSNIHLDYEKNGFDDYISKPFDLNLLYHVLRKHIPKVES